MVATSLDYRAVQVQETETDLVSRMKFPRQRRNTKGLDEEDKQYSSY
jgi:hypothetical protein